MKPKQIRLPSNRDSIVEQHTKSADRICQVVQDVIDSCPDAAIRDQLNIQVIDRLFYDSMNSVLLDLVFKPELVPAGVAPARWREMQEVPQDLEAWGKTITGLQSVIFRAEKGTKSNSDSNKNFPFNRPSEFLAVMDGKAAVTPGAREIILQRNALFCNASEKKLLDELNQACEILNKLYDEIGRNYLPSLVQFSHDEKYHAQPQRVLAALRHR